MPFTVNLPSPDETTARSVYSPGFGTISWTAWFEDLASLEAVGDKLDAAKSMELFERALAADPKLSEIRCLYAVWGLILFRREDERGLAEATRAHPGCRKAVPRHPSLSRAAASAAQPDKTLELIEAVRSLSGR